MTLDTYYTIRPLLIFIFPTFTFLLLYYCIIASLYHHIIISPYHSWKTRAVSDHGSWIMYYYNYYNYTISFYLPLLFFSLFPFFSFFLLIFSNLFLFFLFLKIKFTMRWQNTERRMTFFYKVMNYVNYHYHHHYHYHYHHRWVEGRELHCGIAGLRELVNWGKFQKF